MNNTVKSLSYLNIVRLYLIKSYKGYCHALGKPVNGQRTWSNSWSSFNNNYILRRFLLKMRLKNLSNKLEEKKNYKQIKKKYGVKKNKNISGEKNVNKLKWF